MKAMYLSQEQYDKLVEDLRRLKTVDRPNVISDIAEAREHGDLKENAEYAVAKEKQALIEGKISRLEDTLSRSRIMTPEMEGNDNVRVGSRVKLLDTETGDIEEYELVASAEFMASSLEAVSVESPMGKALVGKVVDDVVEIEVPKGTLTYKVSEIL